MKNKQPRIALLYAAPGVLPQKPEKPEEPDDDTLSNDTEYPRNFDEGRRPVMQGVYACPVPRPELDDAKPFMCVYAGPDQFAAMREDNTMNELYAAPEPEEPEEPEEPVEPEEPEEPGEPSEQERMEELMRKHALESTAVCGLVQAPPDSGNLGLGLMGMAQPKTPNFCPECGQKTCAGDKFCRSCGTRLVK